MMALLNLSFFCIFIVLIVILILIWIKKIKFEYWHKKGLKNPPPILFVGNIWDSVRRQKNFGDVYKDVYNYLRHQNEKHGGMYLLLEPVYIPIDLEIIKRILLTDFENFTDRGIYYNEERDPLSAHLFSLEGIKWKNLRTKLTPTFTSGKMKMMHNLIEKCSRRMVQYLVDNEFEYNQGGEVEIKNVFGCFTTDAIGCCAFGIECDSFQEKPAPRFKQEADKFFHKTDLELLFDIISYRAPNFVRKFGMRAINADSSEFFVNIIKKTVEYRERNQLERMDFMDMLLQLKNSGKLSNNEIKEKEKELEDSNRITFNELAAQAYVFFVAGYETSSTTLSYCFYELAINPDIQDNLVKEIKNVLQKYNNEITFDAIKEMIYLDQVLNETLRKYPPIPLLNRICKNDYTIPDTDIVIESRTKVIIPVLGIHHDPKYYPNPDKFDPERFSLQNKSKIPPYAFLPFGEGPRICIGMRFGILQAKIGLVALLRHFKFSLSPQTKQPLKADPISLSYSTKGGLYLVYKRHSVI